MDAKKRAGLTTTPAPNDPIDLATMTTEQAVANLEHMLEMQDADGLIVSLAKVLSMKDGMPQNLYRAIRKTIAGRLYLKVLKEELP